MNEKYVDQRTRLIRRLKIERRITSKSVEGAFFSISRELFVPNSQKQYAYMDKPLDIGNNQTISAPHMVAIMVEELHLQKDQKILEIGAGSGYHAAIVASIIGANGKVYSVERIQSLADCARANLKNAGIENVDVIFGDGSIGLNDYAPYDRIYVTCAAPRVPQPLIDQLTNEGSLLIPVGDMICELQRITKINDELQIDHLGGCAFVPLIGSHGFQQFR